MLKVISTWVGGSRGGEVILLVHVFVTCFYDKTLPLMCLETCSLPHPHPQMLSEMDK